MSEIQHTIKSVARRTGLSAHVIRVWEKRYGAVRPERTGTNRRVYSEAEVQRLELLHRATQAGHSIGQASKLSTESLREVLVPASPVPSARASRAIGSDAGEPDWVAQCLERVGELDGPGLDRLFEQGVVRFGQMGFINRIAAPLCHRVGEMWRTGELTASHEHFLSAALRTFLGQSTRQFASGESAPGLLVATPAGQLHELGAVMVAAVAANLGWRVTYLGTSLPAAEIAGAAVQNRSRAVALSIVYPEDDPAVAGELTRLRHFLPQEVRILAGGRGASAYGVALNQIGALKINDLDQLAATLQELRKVSN